MGKIRLVPWNPLERSFTVFTAKSCYKRIFRLYRPLYLTTLSLYVVWTVAFKYMVTKRYCCTCHMHLNVACYCCWWYLCSFFSLWPVPICFIFLFRYQDARPTFHSALEFVTGISETRMASAAGTPLSLTNFCLKSRATTSTTSNIECRVCEDVFTIQGEKVPRLLHCGHTLCHQCLSRLPLTGK